MKNEMPKTLNSLLTVKQMGRTRSGDVVTLEVPTRGANLRCADNMFANRAYQQWNSMDKTLRGAETVFGASSISFGNKLFRKTCEDLKVQVYDHG